MPSSPSRLSSSSSILDELEGPEPKHSVLSIILNVFLCLILFTIMVLPLMVYYIQSRSLKLLKANRKPSRSAVLLCISAHWIVFLLAIPLKFFYYSLEPTKFSLFAIIVSDFAFLLIVVTFIATISVQLIFFVLRVSKIYEFEQNCEAFEYAFSMGLSFLLTIIAIVVAFSIQTTTYSINIPGVDSFSIGLATDLHVNGAHHGNNFIDRIAERCVSAEIDALFLVGDVIDVPKPLKTLALTSTSFAALRSITPLGTFAVSGNHDVMSGEAEFEDIMEQGGITVLSDEIVELSDGVVVIGLRDYGRKSDNVAIKVTNLVNKALDFSPTMIIVMIHQPYNQLMEAMASYETSVPIVILSGHTHKGQIIGATFFVPLFYKYYYGQYCLSDKVSLIVSSGIGTWAPMGRLGTRSELVVVTVNS
ncbi:hypothetical protein RCL1_004169 [Eukaryota sp. TZLM3-RCL]